MREEEELEERGERTAGGAPEPGFGAVAKLARGDEELWLVETSLRASEKDWDRLFGSVFALDE